MFVDMYNISSNLVPLLAAFVEVYIYICSDWLGGYAMNSPRNSKF